MNNGLEDKNPYESPLTKEGLTELASYKPRIFSTKGRIGRLRYLAYSLIYNIIIMFLVGIVSAVLVPMMAGNTSGEAGIAVTFMMILIYVPIILVFFIVARRRLHDLDRTGWLTLLMIVPLINVLFGLYLLFGPGSPETNKYGPPPQVNTALEIIVGLITPIVIIGILAAVAIPSYQGYVEKAKQAQTQSQSSTP